MKLVHVFVLAAVLYVDSTQGRRIKRGSKNSRRVADSALDSPPANNNDTPELISPLSPLSPSEPIPSGKKRKRDASVFNLNHINLTFISTPSADETNTEDVYTKLDPQWNVWALLYAISLARATQANSGFVNYFKPMVIEPNPQFVNYFNPLVIEPNSQYVNYFDPLVIQPNTQFVNYFKEPVMYPSPLILPPPPFPLNSE